MHICRVDETEMSRCESFDELHMLREAVTLYEHVHAQADETRARTARQFMTDWYTGALAVDLRR